MVRRRGSPYPCRDHNPSWAPGRGLAQGPRPGAAPSGSRRRHHLVPTVLHDELLLVGREAHDVARVEVKDRGEGPPRRREIGDRPDLRRYLCDLIRCGLLLLAAIPVLTARLVDPAPGDASVRAENVFELHTLGGAVVV